MNRKIYPLSRFISLTIFFFVGLLLAPGFVSLAKTGQRIAQKEDKSISIEYPEVYELSNIILALTKYGQAHPWEVMKGFPYYDEMKTYFKPYLHHPVLDSANFSRKLWDHYLAFRTDAYAFSYDKHGKIKRTNRMFYSFGNLKPFDKFLSLVQDFSDKSHFRDFYAAHKTYYDKITSGYSRYYMIPEAREFLTQEFGHFTSKKKYSVVLSVFVYAHNLHRNAGIGHTADFPPVAMELILGRETYTARQQATQLHTLFTEMDHGSVNPVSDKNYKTLKVDFDEKLWDQGSGYTGHKTAVFNEYMTWAVYDIFLEEYFPAMANELSMYWHLQNESRGFLFSYNFGEKLKELYHHKSEGQHIKDLYIPMLEWCAAQKNLTRPTITSPEDTVIVKEPNQEFTVKFSEPMLKSDQFSMLLKKRDFSSDTLLVNKINELKWVDDGTSVSFRIKIPEAPQMSSLELNTWGTPLPLKSAKGLLLKSYSYIYVRYLKP